VRPIRPWIALFVLALVGTAGIGPAAAQEGSDPSEGQAADAASDPSQAEGAAVDQGQTEATTGDQSAVDEEAPAEDDAQVEDAPGWRVQEAVPTPEWLTFGFTHRLRVEHLDNDYRSSANSAASAVSGRSLLNIGVQYNPVFGTLEIADSWAFLDEAAPADNTLVNPIDVLQLYAGAGHADLFQKGDSVGARLGRFTLDVGSRRLVARNRFRNTINAFTGLDVEWITQGEHTIRTFTAMPVQRRPFSDDEVRDHDVDLDEESDDTLFWGLFYSTPELHMGLKLEVYVFGLHEDDDDNGPGTANRQLATPGFRLHSDSIVGKVDVEIEGAAQLGTSRASTDRGDSRELDHRAFFTHIELGITFPGLWRPRFAAMYDYVSGDRDATDDNNGHFDTLYGARRFEFGPSGIYGILARSNINGPAVRLELEPTNWLDGFVGYRSAYLASDTDAWTSAGVRDPSGNSGRYLGRLIEGRLQQVAGVIVAALLQQAVQPPVVVMAPVPCRLATDNTHAILHANGLGV